MCLQNMYLKSSAIKRAFKVPGKPQMKIETTNKFLVKSIPNAFIISNEFFHEKLKMFCRIPDCLITIKTGVILLKYDNKKSHMKVAHMTHALYSKSF